VFALSVKKHLTHWGGGGLWLQVGWCLLHCGRKHWHQRHTCRRVETWPLSCSAYSAPQPTLLDYVIAKW